MVALYIFLNMRNGINVANIFCLFKKRDSQLKIKDCAFHAYKNIGGLSYAVSSKVARDAMVIVKESSAECNTKGGGSGRFVER